jgi:hypothetical protein
MLVACESNLDMPSKRSPFAYNMLLNIELWKTFDYLPQNRQCLVMHVPYPLVPQLTQVVIVMHQGLNMLTFQPVQITFSNRYYFSCIWARLLWPDEDVAGS